MNKPIFATALLLATIVSVFGQSEATQSPAAQKFDEFGDILYSDLIARLDNFAVQLQNQPHAKGFLIAYRTRRDLPGLSHALALRMKYYLLKTRGLPKDRIVTVDGGIAACLTQELWIVPPGATPTARSDVGSSYSYLGDSAWKFFEYGYLPPELYKRFGVSDYKDTEGDDLEAFADELKKSNTAVACIIAYAQYDPSPGMADYAGNYEPVDEVRLDSAGTARRRLNTEKTLLMKIYGIPASRIRLIDGGYRKKRAVELWIVPRNEALPIPIPNSFPKRKRQQKPAA